VYVSQFSAFSLDQELTLKRSVGELSALLFACVHLEKSVTIDQVEVMVFTLYEWV